MPVEVHLGKVRRYERRRFDRDAAAARNSWRLSFGGGRHRDAPHTRSAHWASIARASLALPATRKAPHLLFDEIYAVRLARNAPPKIILETAISLTQYPLTLGSASVASATRR
jgi:hypothetical protein